MYMFFYLMINLFNIFHIMYVGHSHVPRLQQLKLPSTPASRRIQSATILPEKQPLGLADVCQRGPHVSPATLLFIPVMVLPVPFRHYTPPFLNITNLSTTSPPLSATFLPSFPNCPWPMGPTMTYHVTIPLTHYINPFHPHPFFLTSKSQLAFISIYIKIKNLLPTKITNTSLIC